MKTMRTSRCWWLTLLIPPLLLVPLGGCTVWRIKESANLTKLSQPFQTSHTGGRGRLLIVGDSTAVGTGASAPSSSVAALISRDHPELTIVNRGVNGAKFDDLPQQFADSNDRFDMVLIMAGGNDVIRLTSEDALAAHIQRAAALASERAPVVIFLPSGNAGNAPFFFPPLSWLMTTRSQTLRQLVMDTAQSTGAVYVSLYQPKETDPFAQRPQQMHAADGLHPSDAGYAIWYRELQSQAGLSAKLNALR